MKFLEANIDTLENRGVKRVSPFTIPYFLSNMSAGMIAMEPDIGFRGPNYAINTACATSNYCESRPQVSRREQSRRSQSTDRELFSAADRLPMDVATER